MISNPALLLVFYFGVEIASATLYRPAAEETENWTGRWFPDKPKSIGKVKSSEVAPKNIQTDSLGRVAMGVKNAACDDAKTNLTLDWPETPFICMNPRQRIEPDLTIHPQLEYENIPPAYVAPHFCMNTPIKYTSRIPTFGPHRPLWPKYGEYKFVPKQRWIHNLEHGAIVALYHPCADLGEIRFLKKLVKSCLRRHIITPYSELSRKRPLALVAWGVRLTMSFVDPKLVQQFIQENALRGPEKLPQEGQYDYALREPAAVVSTFEDKDLCPSSMITF